MAVMQNEILKLINFIKCIDTILCLQDIHHIDPLTNLFLIGKEFIKILKSICAKWSDFTVIFHYYFDDKTYFGAQEEYHKIYKQYV